MKMGGERGRKREGLRVRFSAAHGNTGMATAVQA